MNKWIDQRGRQISVLGVAGLVFTFILFASGSSVEAAGTISLGSATSFGILSGAGTTNSGNSVLPVFCFFVIVSAFTKLGTVPGIFSIVTLLLIYFEDRFNQ